MKKYVKPELFYENFELAQHVADCGWELKSGNINECYAQGDAAWGIVDDVHVFSISAACAVLDGDSPNYCYTNSTSITSLYRS